MSTATTDGALETRDDVHVLRFERRLDHPIEKVWAALTEPDHMAEWLAAAEVDLVEGGRVKLTWLNTDESGQTAVMNARITALDPPRLIEYEGDIHGTLRWELREDGDGCVLRFTNTLPAPKEHVSKSLAGWHIHLDHLEDVLAGGSIDWPNWYRDHFEAWSRHRERYGVTGRG
jgi:uncharacterized protein YndB with AHSA1/START domain